MRLLDAQEPGVVRDVPDEIGQMWLTQKDRFSLAPDDAVNTSTTTIAPEKSAEIEINGVEHAPVAPSAEASPLPEPPPTLTAEQKVLET